MRDKITISRDEVDANTTVSLPATPKHIQVTVGDLLASPAPVAANTEPSLPKDAAETNTKTYRMLAPLAVLIAALVILLGVAGLFIARGRSDDGNRWIRQADVLATSGVVLIAKEEKHFWTANELSVGTGFVVAVSGGDALIVTNKHVVGLLDDVYRDPQECYVRTRPGKVMVAWVVGSHIDPQVDLGLVLVKAPELRPLGKIGRFDAVAIGDDVVAIGHPEDAMDFTISRGMVEQRAEQGFIQSSVPINPGNSGGPLMDRDLRIIGVNTFVSKPRAGTPHAFSIRADDLFDQRQWVGEPHALEMLKSVER